MVAYAADYSLLDTGARPDPSVAGARRVLDELDVADLESEHEHAYELLGGSQRSNSVVRSGSRLDGARTQRSRERFFLELVPQGALLVRLGSELALDVIVRVGGREQAIELPESPWFEALIELDPALPSGRQPIEISAPAGSFSSLHYFSLAPAR